MAKEGTPRRTAGRIERPPVTDPETRERETAPAQGVGIENVSEDIYTKLLELGEAADSVVIYKEDEAIRNKWLFIAKLPITDWSPEWLKTEEGGGDYKLVFIDGQKGALGPVLFSIDKQFKGRRATTAANQPPAESPALTFERQVMLELIRGMRQQPPAAAAQQVSVTEIVNAVANLAQLFRPASTAPPNADVLTTSLTLIEKGMELRDQMDGGGDGFTRMLPSLVGLVERLATARGMGGGQAPAQPPAMATLPRPGVVAGGSPNGSPNGASSSTDVRVGGASWLGQFAASLGPRAIRLADSGSDPSLYGELAVDQMADAPPDAAEHIAALVMGKDKTEATAAVAAEIFGAVPALGTTPERRTFVDGFAAAFVDGVTEQITGSVEGTEGGDDGGPDTGTEE